MKGESKNCYYEQQSISVAGLCYRVKLCQGQNVSFVIEKLF